jgi:hypothetical protein
MQKDPDRHFTTSQKISVSMRARAAKTRNQDLRFKSQDSRAKIQEPRFKK